MLTKRQFISILLLFLALFLLFQGPEIAKEKWNDYNTNESRQEDTAKTGSTEEDTSVDNGRCAVYIGDTGSKAFNTFREWASYTKRSVINYSDISDDKKPDLVCIDKTVLEQGDSSDKLQAIFSQGIPVAIVNLPDAKEVMNSKKLRSLLGIYYVRQESVHAKGIHLYKGLFLGGERIYRSADKTEEKKLQDLDLDVPWYVPKAGSRTFMSAIIEDKSDAGLKNQDMPALIWRTKQGSSFVYVVSGSYMDDHRIGMGILSGILSDANDYELYPVVNAQNLVLDGFPQLSDENKKTMQQIYGYSQSAFQKNIIQPDLWTMIRRTGFKPTAMIRARYDYSRSGMIPDGTLQYYLRKLREVHGEAGISYAHTGSSDIQAVKKEADRIVKAQSDGYEYGAAFASGEDLSAVLKAPGSLTTVLTPYSDSGNVIGYLSGSVTRQTILSDAGDHTYSEDLRLLGDESALGYSTALVDITKALWPKAREQEWQNLSDDAFSSLTSYWNCFDAFDKTTLSESGRKVRQLLDLDFEVSAEGQNKLRVKTSHLEGEAAYLLRTHEKEVKSVRGGTWDRVEEDVYLVKVTKNEAVITLKEVRQK